MLWAVWGFLIYMLLIGMAAGWLAWVVLGRSKTLMRDRKPNWTVLLGLGVLGSFVGGLVVSLLVEGEITLLQPSGPIASFLGALVAVAIYVAAKRR